MDGSDWSKIKFLLGAFIGVGLLLGAFIGVGRRPTKTKQKEKTNYLLRLRRWRFHL